MLHINLPNVSRNNCETFRLSVVPPTLTHADLKVQIEIDCKHLKGKNGCVKSIKWTVKQK
jgi:hypothetical protein